MIPVLPKTRVAAGLSKNPLTVGRINGSVESILSGSFDAAPGDKKCQGCDFRALCRHKGFDVGVDFEPVKSGRRSAPAREAGSSSSEQPAPGTRDMKPPVASAHMMSRARKIASEKITCNADG